MARLVNLSWIKISSIAIFFPPAPMRGIVKRTALLLLMAICGSNTGALAQTPTTTVENVPVNNTPNAAGSVNVTLQGDGSSDHPLEIGSVNDWNAFATYVNTVNHGAHAKITADFSFTNNHIQPNYYSGTLDGQGHTITLHQSDSKEGNPFPSSSDSYSWGGLIFRAYGATIKNLRLAGVISNFTFDCGTFVQNGLGNTTIENCQSSVEIIKTPEARPVNSKVSSDGNFSGGMVGGSDSNDTHITIKNCLVDGSFSASGTVEYGYNGGFMGRLVYGRSLTIQNSYAHPKEIDNKYTNFYPFCFTPSGTNVAIPTIQDSYYKFPDSFANLKTTAENQGTDKEAPGTDPAPTTKEATVTALNHGLSTTAWELHNDTIYLKTFAKYVDVQGWVYGSPNAPTIEGNSGDGTVTYQYKVQGAADGTYATYTPSTTVLGAGNYTLKASVAANNGWNAWESTMDFTVSPRPITVTPDEGQSKTYGEADPTLTYTVDDIVTGESLSGSLSRANGTDVGNYAITQGGVTDANNSNYTITFTSGKTFAITQKTATLGWNATSFDYNGSAQAPTASVTNLEAGDDCGVTVSVTGDHSAVGSYTATASALSGTSSGNYVLPEANTQVYEIVRSMGITFTGTQHWNTYCAFEDLATPAGLTAYIITGVSGTTATASVIGYIPKDVGVLLYSASAGSGFKASAYTGTAGTFTSNKLVGVTAATSLAAEAGYILYSDAFVLTTGGTLPANRCYLPASGPASSRGLNIDTGDGTTFINAISKDEMNNERWFDLQGQRIVRPQKKGVYIRNGKKVVIK